MAYFAGFDGGGSKAIPSRTGRCCGKKRGRTVPEMDTIDGTNRFRRSVHIIGDVSTMDMDIYKTG